MPKAESFPVVMSLNFHSATIARFGLALISGYSH